jgi:phosphoserine phosphatase
VCLGKPKRDAGQCAAAVGDVQALEERLKILDCTPGDLQAFTAAHPPVSRMMPGALPLIAALQARGVEVYLISGGFRWASAAFWRRNICMCLAEAHVNMQHI